MVLAHNLKVDEHARYVHTHVLCVPTDQCAGWVLARAQKTFWIFVHVLVVPSGEARWWSRNHICLISHWDLFKKSFSAGEKEVRPVEPPAETRHVAKQVSPLAPFISCLRGGLDVWIPEVDRLHLLWKSVCVCATCYILSIKMCKLLAKRWLCGWFSQH